MERMTAIILCFVYLTLAPLCVMHFDRAITHNQGGHMQHTAESAPLPLSYHVAMYQSFTTTLVALSLLLLGALFVFGSRVARFHILHHRTVHRVPSASPEQPPDSLLQRLSLLTHAPPYSA